MKKTLAFLLALVMILSISLVACQKNDPEPDDNDDDDWGNGGTTESVDSSSESQSNTNGDNNDPLPPSNVWTDKNDKVYAGMNGVRIRTAPSTDSSSSIVGTVTVGTALDRIGTNGVWDKILYNGEERYVSCSLVAPIGTHFSFTDVEPAVTLTMNGTFTINIRSTPFVPKGDYARQNLAIESFSAANGTLTKVGVSTSGSWYKVTYVGTINGVTYDGTEDLYIAASNVTDGYVSDPTVPSGPVGGIG